jgi:hypothetical protein
MQLAPMKHARGKADAVTLQDKMYVVGGQGPNRENYNHGEYYDPKAGVWHDLPLLDHGREGCTVETIGGSLYCAGGYLSAGGITSVERCDPREGWWEEVIIPSLHTHLDTQKHPCAHMHVHVHPNMQGMCNTAMEAHSHTDTHTHTHTRTHTHTHTHTQRQTHTDVLCLHSNTYRYIHTHTHSQTHTDTDTHTYRHMQTQGL